MTLQALRRRNNHLVRGLLLKFCCPTGSHWSGLLGWPPGIMGAHQLPPSSGNTGVVMKTLLPLMITCGTKNSWAAWRSSFKILMMMIPTLPYNLLRFVRLSGDEILLVLYFCFEYFYLLGSSYCNLFLVFFNATLNQIKMGILLLMGVLYLGFRFSYWYSLFLLNVVYWCFVLTSLSVWQLSEVWVLDFFRGNACFSVQLLLCYYSLPSLSFDFSHLCVFTNLILDVLWDWL